MTNVKCRLFYISNSSFYMYLVIIKDTGQETSTYYSFTAVGHSVIRGLVTHRSMVTPLVSFV